MKGSCSFQIYHTVPGPKKGKIYYAGVIAIGVSNFEGHITIIDFFVFFMNGPQTSHCQLTTIRHFRPKEQSIQKLYPKILFFY